MRGHHEPGLITRLESRGADPEGLASGERPEGTYEAPQDFDERKVQPIEVPEVGP